MRVPIVINENKRLKLERYVASGVSEENIVELMGIPWSELEHDVAEIKLAIIERKEEKEKAAASWLITDEAEQETLLKHLQATLTIDEIATLMKKQPSVVADLIRDWRNDLAHNANPKWKSTLSDRVLKRIMILGSDASWRQHREAGGVKAKAKATVIKKRQTKKMGNDSRYNRKTNRYIMDEWRSFGVLEQVRVHPESIGLRSADGNIAHVKKKYTPNHGDILLKARGLKGKFVAVRMVQNFDTTEPRVIDISASQGIMSMATAFPDDTRNQSFTGRYLWKPVGLFTYQKYKENGEDLIYVHAEDNTSYVYESSRHHPDLVQRFLDRLGETEDAESSLLVCIDQKNTSSRHGDLIVDAHQETAAFEEYAEDHNTALERIARVRDEADSSLRKLSDQKLKYQQEMVAIQEKIKADLASLEQSFKLTEETESQVKAVLERDVAGLEEQERFLRDAKEGLHEYKVQLLAKERDKAGKAVAVKMKGLKVVAEDEPETDAQFEKRMVELEKTGDRGARQAAAYRKIKEKVKLLKARKARRAKLQSDDVIEVPPSDELEVEVDPPELDLTLFDDKKSEEQMPSWAKQFFAKVDRVIQLHQMSETDKNQLNDYLKEEELEEGQDRSEFNQQVMDILDKKEELFAEPFKVKVYSGHSKNSIAVRFGVDLTQKKDKDRLLIDVVSHIRANQFLCRLPDYNNIECSLALVLDSNDKKDVAVKSALFYHNSKSLQKAQNKVIKTGGKRLFGSSMAKYIEQHKEIYELAGLTPPLETPSFEEL